MKKKAKKSMPMKLKDYLQKVDWYNVAVELVGIYPRERRSLEKYWAVFESLKEMEPVMTEDQLVIESFDMIPEYLSPFYLVYGRKDPEDEGDTLAFTPWAEWLGRDVVFDPPRWLSYDRIVAVCLHAMTSYGFTEEQIREEKALMKHCLEEEAENRQDSSAPEEEYEPDWEDYRLGNSMKESLGKLRKWLRWGSISREYFGKDGTWFVNQFIGPDAPEYYDELDEQTLRAALKEIAQDLVWVAKEL